MTDDDIHANYDHQATISQKLNEFAHTIIAEPIHPLDGTEFTGKHFAFFGLINKALSTHDAVGLLASKGFVDDGYSLIRTAVEAVINAAYIMWVGGDKVAADYFEFHYYRDWKEFAALKAVSEKLAAKLPPERVAQLQKDYERVKDRFKGSDWATMSLPDRALAVDKKIEEESGQQFHEMRYLYCTPWREGSHYAHGNAKAIAQAFEQGKDATVLIHRQATKEEAAHLLDMSNFVTFSLLAVLDLQLGSKNRDEYLRLQKEWLGTEAQQTKMNG